METTKRLKFFHSKNNGYLLFCGNSNSIYKVEDSEVEKINKVLKNDYSCLTEKEIIDFIKSGIIVDSDEKLINNIKYKNLCQRFSTTYLNLTIALTMNCNFKCPYCYEGLLSESNNISEEVIFKTVDFIKEWNAKEVSILWYGGEPLLQWEKILFFNQLFEERNFKVKQSIITNGSLLNDEIIEFMLVKNFEFIQITLDGLEKTHNSFRPMKNGKNSFHLIISNLDKLYSFIKKIKTNTTVIIRTNFNKDNIDEYFEFYMMLEEKYGDVFVFDPNFIKNISCHTDSSAFSWNETANIILKECSNNRLKKEKLFNNKNSFLSCGAQCYNQYVIDPKGNLFKCLDDINDKTRVVGNILTNEPDLSNLITTYSLKTDPFEIEECKSCLFLFSCMGGCPKQRLQNQKSCSFIKSDPCTFLETFYELKKFGDINE